MTRIFEVKTVCPSKKRGDAPINTTYRVACADAEKAIARIKRDDNYSNLEKVIPVVLLASTD